MNEWVSYPVWTNQYGERRVAGQIRYCLTDSHFEVPRRAGGSWARELERRGRSAT